VAIDVDGIGKGTWYFKWGITPLSDFSKCNGDSFGRLLSTCPSLRFPAFGMTSAEVRAFVGILG
jgi:hypothetical protein